MQTKTVIKRQIINKKSSNLISFFNIELFVSFVIQNAFHDSALQAIKELFGDSNSRAWIYICQISRVKFC